jgi:hypothetical protein
VIRCNKYFVYFFVVNFLVFTGCATTIPPEALQWNKETLKQRQLQTRKFDTQKEGDMLSSCAALLQDLGFSLDESETELGMLLGSKERDATDAGQVAAMIVIALLGGGAVPIDSVQKMRASIITHLNEDGSSMLVRVTFQRVVWNTSGQVTTSESMNDPEIYQEFFSKLSKAVFLEAHEI